MSRDKKFFFARYSLFVKPFVSSNLVASFSVKWVATAFIFNKLMASFCFGHSVLSIATASAAGAPSRWLRPTSSVPQSEPTVNKKIRERRPHDISGQGDVLQAGTAASIYLYSSG